MMLSGEASLVVWFVSAKAEGTECADLDGGAEAMAMGECDVAIAAAAVVDGGHEPARGETVSMEGLEDPHPIV